MLNLGRRELEARLGSVRDALGPRILVEHDGPGRGNRVALLRSGAGLEAFVSLDRAMDLRDVWWQGRPVAFASSAGDAAGSAFDGVGSGWLRSWGGGLLTTCGLRNVGEAVDDGAEHFGQHGRITSCAASEVRAWSEWQGDRFVSTVAGVVREATVAGEHLELAREVSVVAGENVLRVRDVIRNVGHRPEPLLVLYHCNVGWPLLDEGATVEVSSVGGADFATGAPLPDEAWQRAPGVGGAGAHDGVVVHQVKGEEAFARVGPLRIVWHPDQLPHLCQWISSAPGTYVMSFEPGNCQVAGRVAELAAGRGEVLEPGQEKKVDLRFEFT